MDTEVFFEYDDGTAPRSQSAIEDDWQQLDYEDGESLDDANGCVKCGGQYMLGSQPAMRFPDKANDDQKFTADIELRACITCGYVIGRVQVYGYTGF